MVDGRALKMLCVIDEYTRECLAIETGASLRSQDVILTLSRLMRLYGKPAYIRSDNGAEFTAAKVMRWLRDGDLASNAHGWQWTAGCGTDAAPYFRIFNPVSQSQRFDSNGTFLRHWLPERAKLDNKSIHLPHNCGELFFAVDNYPSAIVDLGRSRFRALDAFKHLPKRNDS